MLKAARRFSAASTTLDGKEVVVEVAANSEGRKGMFPSFGRF